MVETKRLRQIIKKIPARPGFVFKLAYGNAGSRFTFSTDLNKFNTPVICLSFWCRAFVGRDSFPFAIGFYI